jgi:hypothetical protein
MGLEYTVYLSNYYVECYLLKLTSELTAAEDGLLSSANLFISFATRVLMQKGVHALL